MKMITVEMETLIFRDRIEYILKNPIEYDGTFDPANMTPAALPATVDYTQKVYGIYGLEISTGFDFNTNDAQYIVKGEQGVLYEYALIGRYEIVESIINPEKVYDLVDLLVNKIRVAY